MSGRNGPVDDWDDADELASRVGFFSELNRHTAGRVLVLIEQVRRASVYLTQEMIAQRGEQVILRVPPEKREPIEQEMRDAHLLQEVLIQSASIPQDVPRPLREAKPGAQKLLF